MTVGCQGLSASRVFTVHDQEPLQRREADVLRKLSTRAKRPQRWLCVLVKHIMRCATSSASVANHVHCACQPEGFCMRKTAGTLVGTIQYTCPLSAIMPLCLAPATHGPATCRYCQGGAYQAESALIHNLMFHRQHPRSGTKHTCSYVSHVGEKDTEYINHRITKQRI